MRLSKFIVANLERIISEWEAFAGTLIAGRTLDVSELRDHAKQILTVIARDLETPQTRQEGSAKSKGRSDSGSATPDTPAQAHGSERAASGFVIEDMAAEYRALRASVTRLWTESKQELDAADVRDLVRFNESIDQALAESTSRFARELDRVNETFLGILGHDLRTPLGAIITSAQFTLDAGDLPTAQKMAAVIVNSGRRMNHMVDDLLDFTRSRLGEIPVERHEVNLQGVLDDAVKEIRAYRPGTAVRLETSGDLGGEWDAPRMRQVLSNLLSNALDHGSQGTPITVTARAGVEEVELAVHNCGPAIPENEIPQLFDPLHLDASGSREAGHLGLGLYIVDRIVAAHGGSVHVESTEPHGTTFTVHLPR